MSVIYRIVRNTLPGQNVGGVLVALTVWLIYLAGNSLQERVGFIAASIAHFHPWFVTAGFYRANIFRSRLWS